MKYYINQSNFRIIINGLREQIRSTKKRMQKDAPSGLLAKDTLNIIEQGLYWLCFY